MNTEQQETETERKKIYNHKKEVEKKEEKNK